MEDHLIGDELNIPDGIKKIGLAMSGGVESSLLFYLLYKKIIDDDLDVTIHPLILCDLNQTFLIKIIHNILNLVDKNLIVKKPVFHIIDYDRKYTTENLKKFLDPIKRNVDIIASGTSRWPPVSTMSKICKSVRFNQPDRSRQWELPKMDIFDEEWKPFINMHKQDIALIYKMYDLKELFKLTVSCANYYIDENEIGIVCKECMCCDERKWAFKTFDNEWLL